jgi:hypothetical protein
VYHTSMRYLTLDEIQSPLEMQSHLEFYEAVLKKLGPSMPLDGFKDDLEFADFETSTL